MAVDSTSDERVANNVMRHEYRVLSEEEKLQMKGVKDLGLEFLNLLHSIGGTQAGSERYATRELANAGTRIEEAVMWAVKHVTGEKR